VGCSEAPEHEADHCEAHEGFGFSGMTLVVARQSPVLADPCQGALDDPSLRQDDEVMAVAATHDLKHPSASPSDGGLHLAALVTGIADDALNEGEGPSGLPQQVRGPIPILHARGMHVHGQ
jgi:hypothetical protein